MTEHSGIARQSDMAFLRRLSRKGMVRILTARDRMDAFVVALDHGLHEKASRSAREQSMKIYSEMMMRCGIEHGGPIAQQIVVQLGARDERDAARKIAMVNDAERRTPEQQIDDAAAWLEELLDANPQLRGQAVDRLARALHAVPQLNPHTNGEAIT